MKLGLRSIRPRLYVAGRAVSLAAVAIFFGACPPYQPTTFAPYPVQVGAQEYHRCTNGLWCAEGYACSRFGCEWCGEDLGSVCHTPGVDDLIP